MFGGDSRTPNFSVGFCAFFWHIAFFVGFPNWPIEFSLFSLAVLFSSEFTRTSTEKSDSLWALDSRSSQGKTQPIFIAGSKGKLCFHQNQRGNGGLWPGAEETHRFTCLRRMPRILVAHRKSAGALLGSQGLRRPYPRANEGAGADDHVADPNDYAD